MNKSQASNARRSISSKRMAMIPSLDNYSSRKEWEEVCWRRIVGSQELLDLLVTPHERRDLVMRAAAMEGLASGKSYRQISREFFVSLQTISGAKKAVAENSYRSYAERGKKERKKREYSAGPTFSKPKRRGRPVRTKYGTIHIPY